MKKLSLSLAIFLSVFCVGLAETSWGRGFGGMHGGMRGGGMHGGGAMRGGMGGMRPGGNFGGARPGGNFGGARSGGNFGGARPGGNFGGGNFGGARPGGGVVGTGRGPIYGQAGARGQFGGASGLGADRAGAGGLGASRFPGAGGGGLAGRSPESNRRAPDRNQLNNFLGMPSDSGMHKLAGNRDVKAPIRRNELADSGARANRLGRDDRGMRRYSGEDLRRRGNYVRRGFNGRGFYSRDWYRRYPGAWVARAWARDDIWAAMSWDEMYDYFGYGEGIDPMYYDYGNNVTYQDNSVYVNGQSVGTSDEYYQQAQDLAGTGADAKTTDDAKWMPLGVFAMTHNDQTKANLILQLAVNKQGIIRGNYTATLVSHTVPLSGSVDKKSQRAAWTIGDNKDNVFETGIDNLTKDEVPMLVHLGKDKTEQWVLVRLKDDGDSQQESSQ